MSKYRLYGLCTASLILLAVPLWAQLPLNWTGLDIGDSSTGSAGESAGTWTITGDGSDIWSSSDGFQYAFYPLSGDGFIETRVLSPGFSGGSHEWAKAGVMIRESIAAGSRHAFMAVTRNTDADHFLAFQYRQNTDDSSTDISGSTTQPYPVWLRLSRNGDNFTGEYSLDEGFTWLTQYTREIPMSSDVLLGLAVTSHEQGVSTTVRFDNVNYTGSGQSQKPQVNVGPDINITLPDNQVTLDGTVRDDGLPLPANPSSPDPDDTNKLRWSWSVVSVPAESSGITWSGQVNGEAFTYEGSPNPPGTIFETSPSVTFDVAGQYVFKLTAHDGQETASEDVSVVVFPPGADEKGYLYLSPVPGASYVSNSTEFILVRFTDISPFDLTNLDSFITVSGASSGNHPGTAKIASDDRTVIFDMSTGFSSGELVTVILAPNVKTGTTPVQPYSYQFAITSPMPGSLPAVPADPPEVTLYDQPADLDIPRPPTDPVASPGNAGIMPNGVSVPRNFPHIEITTNDNPDPAYIFLDNRSGGDDSYNVIFDNTGSPVWYLQTDDERRDMKVQHNGMLTMLARSPNRFIGLNTDYEQIASYSAINGYSTDEHELQVLENGHYLLIGLRSNTVDMSRYISGGQTSCSVGETVIQEFTPQGDLVFQWRAWDNYDPADVHLDNPRGSSFRFPHMNAIDIDTDGNILVSCRHLSEITKINRDSGKIIWRLSGIPKNSSFTFTNDPLMGTRNQHAVRATGNNRYLMFDNGNLHSPSESRGVEYELDLDNMTAKIVWQYPETPTSSIYSHYMGNTQRLDNGNTLINWAVGALPKLTEVSPDGTVAFEMNWVDRREAYRVWRCPWNGMALRPNLIIEPYPDNITLLFNKFGDPDVDHYNIYGGTSPDPTAVIATSKTTLKQLAGLENGLRYYFRVTAVDSRGNESDFSDQQSIVVNITVPGQNMVINGDFSSDTTGWTFSLTNGAQTQWTINDGVSYFDITDPGSQTTDILLFQNGMKLSQGQKYVLQFDARALSPRYIEAQVASELITPYITPVQAHYRHIFTMNSQSNYNARIAFNLGAFPQGIYLDNISFMSVLDGDFDFNGCIEYEDLDVLVNEWLMQKSGLTADLDDNGIVEFNDFAPISQSWLKPCILPDMILVTERSPRYALVPKTDIGRRWTGTSEPYDDSGWQYLDPDVISGPIGIGYENNPTSSTSYSDLIGYSVQLQMSDTMTSCYIRIPFTIADDPAELTRISLNMRYDDGFVAYINGVELTRANLLESTSAPDWNDSADNLHDDSAALELQPFIVFKTENPEIFQSLKQETNILAVHGLNDNLGSSDFLISPTLTCR